MPTFKLVLEYDGTAYHGWQSQRNAESVQATLEAKLAIVLRHAVRVVAAGRTDSGVHAHGQVVSFATPIEVNLGKLLRGLNGLLPQTVRVRSIEEAPSVFDARRDAMSKTYRYTYWDHPVASVFWRRWSWHAKAPLDELAMDKAAKALVGEHDFSAFRAAGCSARHPVRRMLDAGVIRKGNRVEFRITGQAFLHQMVRIISGTLFDIGVGKHPAGHLSQVLASKDRKKAGKTAPSDGLVLWEVAYGAIPRPGRMVKGKLVQERDSDSEMA